MIRTTDCNRATNIAFYANRRTFGLKNGTIIHGSIDTIESEYDNPNGIGCIDVVTEEMKTTVRASTRTSSPERNSPTSMFPICQIVCATESEG